MASERKWCSVYVDKKWGCVPEKRKKGRRWSKKRDAPLRKIWEQLYLSWCERHTIEGAAARSFWEVRVHVWGRYRREEKRWGWFFWIFFIEEISPCLREKKWGCHFLEFEESVRVLEKGFFFVRKSVHVLERRSDVVIFENLRNQYMFWKNGFFFGRKSIINPCFREKKWGCHFWEFEESIRVLEKGFSFFEN